MLIQELFRFLEEKDIEENQFETAEEAALIQRVAAKIPDINERPPAGEPESMSLLYDLISYERENAFKIGFKTAITLIIEGGQINSPKL